MFPQRSHQVPGCFWQKKPAQKASEAEQELLCVMSLEGACKNICKPQKDMGGLLRVCRRYCFRNRRVQESYKEDYRQVEGARHV